MKKNSGMKIGVFLAVTVVFFTGQALWAQGPTCELEISGSITGFIDDENAIVVADGSPEGVTVYGIPLNYLKKWDVVKIDDVISVDIDAHQCPVNGKIMACEISFDEGEPLDLRPREGKPESAETSGGARQGRSL